MPTQTKNNKLISDSFKSVDSTWKICESNEKSKVDGQNILARVQGPFFLVEGTSLNNRFYSRELWTKAIASVNERLSSGGLFGTIGHDQPLDEAAIMDGKVSHVVTELWIEGKTGMGEILVLNTEAGRNLNALLRAGLRIPVSSRAYGTYLGKGPMGEDVVDPDTFILEGFDFVVTPGVGTAYPKVVENAEVSKIMEHKNMELNERLVEEKIDLQIKLNEALAANREISAKADQAVREAQNLKNLIKFYKAKTGNPEQVRGLNEGLRKFLELDHWRDYAEKSGLLSQFGLTPEVTIKKLLKVGESYAKLGSPEGIAKQQSALNDFSKIGSIEEIKQLTQVAESYTKIGTIKQIKALVEAFKQYKQLGSLDEIKKLCTITEAYSKNGSPARTAEMAEELKIYQELGTPTEINQVLSVAESYFKIGGKPRQLAEKLKRASELETKLNEAKRKNAARKIAEKLNVPEKAAFDLLGKLPAKEVIEHLKSLKEANEITGRLKVSEGIEKTKPTRLNGNVVKMPGSSSTLSERFFKESYLDSPENREPHPGMSR